MDDLSNLISKVGVNDLLLAAEQGDANHQYLVGCMYKEGQGVQQNFVEAFNWYHKAAEQGDSDSQCAVGSMYALGQGVPLDFVKAHEWLSKAALQGHTIAQKMAEGISTIL
jgi:hypothetical protein